MLLFQSTLPVWGATINNIGNVLTGNLFQSTLPVWGATTNYHTGLTLTSDFNPHSPCGERHFIKLPSYGSFKISIHTPRVGSDCSIFCRFRRFLYFNPHSPCGERQPCKWIIKVSRYFNPHSPCGERPTAETRQYGTLPFQSTLPVWGATGIYHLSITYYKYFNPHSPCGERHFESFGFSVVLDISIHTPRVGSDYGYCRLLL